MTAHMSGATHMGEVFHLVRTGGQGYFATAQGMFFTTPCRDGLLEMHALSHEYRIIEDTCYTPPDLASRRASF